jgi:hypothetical protein
MARYYGWRQFNRVPPSIEGLGFSEAAGQRFDTLEISHKGFFENCHQPSFLATAVQEPRAKAPAGAANRAVVFSLSNYLNLVYTYIYLRIHTIITIRLYL